MGWDMGNAIRREWLTEGYEILPQFLDPREVHRLARSFERLLSSARTGRLQPETANYRCVMERDPFRLHRVVWCEGAEPSFHGWGDHPRFLEVAARQLRSPSMVQLLQQAHFKLPGDGVAFGWHQDASNRRYGSELWTGGGLQGGFVQIAVAVDEMGPHNGGLWVIPGSHRLGFVADPVTGRVPQALIDEGKATALSLQPGDAVAFGPFLIHGSPPNQSEGSRRLFLQGYALPEVNRRVYPGSGLGVPRIFCP